MMIEYTEPTPSEESATYDRLLTEYRKAQRLTTYTASVHGEAIARENAAWQRLIEFEGRQGRKQN